jgi:uncharacterized protein (DUF433 family)
MADVEVKEFGKYIVADPRICHGQWTFRGTRIMVWIVLDQVAREMPWEAIVGEWRGRVPKEAIAEAVQLAREALVASNDEWRSAALAQLSIAG